jgi:hypothetical protein
VLPPNLKFVPGHRVRVNDKAREKYPAYVGMYASIGIGGISARHYFLGEYFVSVWLPSEAKVILLLAEECLDDAQPNYGLFKHPPPDV